MKKIEVFKVWLLLLILTTDLLNWTQSEDIHEITVLDKSSVLLPCKPASENKGAVAIIILWYLGNSPEPFYSYDLRQNERGNHWSDDSVFGRRAQFDSRKHPLGLKLDPVQPSDEQIYRCRVDFERGPSKAFRIKLNVVVLPSVPVVTDESGRAVGDVAGPFKENEMVILTCKTTGGRPPPILVWTRGGSVVEDSYSSDSDGNVRNLLHLNSITRNLLEAKFNCRASNNNITKPIDKTVTLNITLAPLFITLSRLRGTQEYVEAGRDEALECLTMGSRPDPDVTWWRDGTKVIYPNVTETRLTNKTVSILKLRPTPSDMGVIITCRVENPSLPGSVLEDSIKLNVFYAPKVSLRMGFGLNPRAIREDSDVFIECGIQANPAFSKITWLHQNKEITQNVSEGIIISNQTLVIQKMRKESSGSYQCQTSNTMGNGLSKSIIITVMYAPICISNTDMYHQISRHTSTNITCHVDAQPQNVTFRWQFNSSGGLLDLGEDTIFSKETTSVLTYSTSKPADYGMIFCTAQNIMGVQFSPCVFNVTAAKPPQLLESCVIRNQSNHTVLVVSCDHMPTELPTAFTLEVRTSDDLSLVKSVKNNVPSFVAVGLTPGTAYTLYISVKTPMGQSTPIKLKAFTVKTAEQIMGRTKEPTMESHEITPIVLGAIVGLVLTLLIMLVITVKFCSKRRHPVNASSKRPKDAPQEGSASVSTKDTLSNFSRHSSDSEEKNPDLIPLSSECSYPLEELRVPTCSDSEPTPVALRQMPAGVPSLYSGPIHQLSSSSHHPLKSCYTLQRPSNSHQLQQQSHPSSYSSLVIQSQTYVEPLSNINVRSQPDAQYKYQEGLLADPSTFPPPEAFRGSGDSVHCTEATLKTTKEISSSDNCRQESSV